MDAYQPLRERYLAEHHGSPFFATVALTLGLSANKPDDGPMVRLGWPLDVALDRAIEVIQPEGISRDNLRDAVISAAKAEGYLLGGKEAGS